MADHTPARWYSVDKDGIATICADQTDAIKVAEESAQMYPRNAPYVAVQLVPVGDEPAQQDEVQGAVISAYRIGEGIIPIKVERVQQIEGPDLWAVRRAGACLGSNGWEWEPMPSSRDDEFLKRCRYASAKEAIDAAMLSEKDRT